MAEITAATVKELRERTGAGMMDCKKALGETDGDMEAAIDWLRTKGLAAAAKKAGRTAAEGLVGVAVDGTKGAVVEVNSRDRLRRQERAVPGFRAQRRARSRWRTGGRHRGAQGRAYWPGGGTVEREADQQHRHDRRESVAPPRRPSRSRRGRRSSPTSTMRVAPGLGKIGVLVALESERRRGRARGARQAARHAHRRGQSAGAATATSSTRTLVERERAIAAGEGGRDRQAGRHRREDGRRRDRQVPQGECAALASSS